jgi:hypothetical protein
LRLGTTADAEAIMAWVCAHTRVDEATLPELTARVLARDKALHLEPPTRGRLARLAHAALRSIEEQFLTAVAAALSAETRQTIDARLTATPSPLSLTSLTTDPGQRSRDRLVAEVETRHPLHGLPLPHALLAPLSSRDLRRLKRRVAADTLHELRRHPDPIRSALVALCCDVRTQEITDSRTDRRLHLVHKMGITADKRVDTTLMADVKRVAGKTGLLFQRAEVSLAHPAGQGPEVIDPVVGEETLPALVQEFRATGRSYREHVQTVRRGSYRHPHRRMVPQLLSALAFRANHDQHQPVMEALSLLRQDTGSHPRF